ncbi:MAG TPA: squalene synthase HpnC [Trebonia sp.]|nr:squalene synthase HpnC [Trebonia sp.]
MPGTVVPGMEAPAPARMAVAGEVSLAVAAKASAENFPVALRILPGALRRHLTAYYGFARLADDLGDEPLPGVTGHVSAAGEREARLRLLDGLERDVARIYDGQPPELPAIAALGETVRACGIPFRPLADLIQANRQDQLVSRYDTYADLVRYCELSANPVGQVVLYIVGAATPERIAASDQVCTALQLVEHWQDVAEDLRNGRVYLPQEDLKAHGVTEDDLARATASPGVLRLMAFETGRATRLLDEGAPLAGTLDGFARVAICGYIAGGRAALRAIREAGYDVLKATPRPGKAATLAGLASCYVRGR